MVSLRRNKSKDGFDNKVEGYVLTHFRPLWKFIQRRPRLEKLANKTLINSLIYKIPTRPNPVSTMAEYTSWDSLTDRTFTGRHLPPIQQSATLPTEDDVVKLFERAPGKTILSPKSTMLFAHFAQWFTDGFLRTDRENFLKNTSNHDIDLCQLYGLNRAATKQLRSHEGGKLKSQIINGEEYPCYYFDENGTVRNEYEGLPTYIMPELDAEKKAAIFAMGVDRANIHPGYVMFNTLFLREHNRICGLLARNYPDWDDERLFQTARNIMIVLLMKVVVDEYINHISPYNFEFRFDARSFWKEHWYRQNWMSVEFSLVYRWHALIPDKIQLNGKDYSTEEALFNNFLLTSRGLGAVFEDSSLQPAGEIGLSNTPRFLLETERASIELSRQARLGTYNDYRELCGYPRVTAFDQITGNSEVQRQLEEVYGHVDNIEFYVGLFAEDVRPNSALAPLIGRLVGIDAFSQALTNPLLSEHVFNERTFSPVGLKLINQTSSLSDILHRNVPKREKKYRVTMTQRQGGQVNSFPKS